MALFMASTSYAQSDTSSKINLNLNKVGLNSLITNIESQTYFHFYYDSLSLGNIEITYTTAPKKITTALAEIFT